MSGDRGGMIVAPQVVAAEAGREVLRRGGNAVDAAVTCGLVQGVVDPHMCGIGGCGAMALWLAEEQRAVVLEFFARAGSLTRPDQWEKLFIREAVDRYGYVLEGAVNDCGYQSIGVPGTVAGFDEALRRFGTIGWDAAVEPAVALASDGFQVTGNAYNTWVGDGGPDMVPIRERMGWTPEAARLYLPGGDVRPLGSTMRNPDLAATLTRLGQAGARDFYEGELASRIAEDIVAGGGHVTAEDLAGYRVRESAPVRGTYRGLDVVATGPPAGGMTLLQLLNFLEGFDLRAMGWPSVDGALARVRAMEFAFGDRERYLADPAFTSVPVERLTEKEYAAAARVAHDSPTTTHVCVVDGAGNAVSMTHTLGASSGVITPGLGFIYNNYMNCFDPRPGRANSIAPGKTRITMMVPTFGFDDGRLALVAGAPGGTRIVGGVLQTLLGVVDHELTPLEAVSAPRVDYQGEIVQVEQRVTSDIVGALTAAGYPVTRRPLGWDGTFSRVQLIQIAADGTMRGASDPRKDGGIALTA